MSEENKSLAKGAELNAETWADFVARLWHDCEGGGVKQHYTADAIFVVQARRLVYGIDDSYTDKKCVICDDSVWHSIEEFWADLGDSQQAALNSAARDVSFLEDGDVKFLDLEEYEQWEILAELPEHTVTGWDKRWEYVNSHFTKDAAEAFIARKKHDYRDGIRVYVEAQTHCWEYNAIKAAILSGSLQFLEVKQ